VAIQCRDFTPDTGTVTLYRHSAWKGVRMDGIGYSGMTMTITPYFDSLIVKYTATGAVLPSQKQWPG
jgi:pyruvate carboxylase